MEGERFLSAELVSQQANADRAQCVASGVVPRVESLSGRQAGCVSSYIGSTPWDLLGVADEDNLTRQLGLGHAPIARQEQRQRRGQRQQRGGDATARNARRSPGVASPRPSRDVQNR